MFCTVRFGDSCVSRAWRCFDVRVRLGWCSEEKNVRLKYDVTTSLAMPLAMPAALAMPLYLLLPTSLARHASGHSSCHARCHAHAFCHASSHASVRTLRKRLGVWAFGGVELRGRRLPQAPRLQLVLLETLHVARAPTPGLFQQRRLRHFVNAHAQTLGR